MRWWWWWMTILSRPSHVHTSIRTVSTVHEDCFIHGQYGRDRATVLMSARWMLPPSSTNHAHRVHCTASERCNWRHSSGNLVDAVAANVVTQPRTAIESILEMVVSSWHGSRSVSLWLTRSPMPCSGLLKLNYTSAHQPTSVMNLDAHQSSLSLLECVRVEVWIELIRCSDLIW